MISNNVILINWNISGGGGEREVIETKQYRLTFRKTLARRKQESSKVNVVHSEHVD